MEPLKTTLPREARRICLGGSVSAPELKYKWDWALPWEGDRLGRVCSMNWPICAPASRLHHADRPGQASGSRPDRGDRSLMRGGGDSLTRAWLLLYGLQLTGNIVNGVIGFLPGVVSRREVWLSKVRGEVQSANKMRQAGFSFLRLFDRLLFPLKKFLKIVRGADPQGGSITNDVYR